MKAKLIPVLIANLFAASAAMAADVGGMDVSGSVSLGFRGLKDTATDGFKLNEYRDLGSSTPIGVVDVQGHLNDRDYLNFFGENFGRDDQYLDLKGGRYGVFKYGLYDDQMTHNLGFGLSTPLAGAGGTNLTGSFRNNAFPTSLSQPPGNWNTFNDYLKRDNYGGFLEFTNNSPWHVRFDGGVVTMRGNRPSSGMLGTGSGNGFMEFPDATDYKTTNLALDAGYTVKRGQFNISVLQSKFNNSNPQQNWWNPLYGATDTTLNPPDNELVKWAANGVLRQLPFNSTLSGRFTYSKTTNNLGVMTTSLDGAVPVAPAVNAAALSRYTANPSTFNGEHKIYSASLAYASQWSRQLDSRIYWNYYDKQDKSTPITYSYTTDETDTYRWHKNNFGVDLGYRFNPEHKLAGGYEYLQVNRYRDDTVETRDNKIYGEYKNNQLDYLGARFRYEYKQRRSDWNIESSAQALSTIGAATTPNPTWFTMFDVANFDQSLVKLTLDSDPMPFLDLGFDMIYKRTSYTDRPYGRNNDWRQEYGLNASYGDRTKFRVTAFADWEMVQYDQQYRSACTGTCDPALLTGTQYVWGSTNRSNNYLAGIGFDWPTSERFLMKGSYMWTKTTGGVDFSTTNYSATGPGSVIGGTLFTAVPFVTDNTTKQTLNLKGIYKYSKSWDFTGGYAFERYNYHDDQLSNGYNGYYPYVMNVTANTNVSYLTGQFANPSYTAHIYYLMATYKF